LNVTSPPGSPGFVRPAAVADAQAIAAVHVAGWRSAYAGLLPAGMLAGLDAGQWAVRRRERLADPPDGVFELVFEQGGQVRAFVAGGPARDGGGIPGVGGEVYALYVDPGYQGRGAGTRLLEAAARRLAGAGFARATLWVLAENAPARGFYESQGWRWDGAEHEWAYEGGRSLEVRYARDLGPGPG
jgi:ribosomal protein S18 acetylase RimI-like enzyme